MSRFVTGQPRPPGAGRRKGSKPKVPQTLKAVIDRLGTVNVKLFETAMLRGLRARPPFSAPYLKIVAERVLGPVPKEVPPPGTPFYLVFLKGALGQYDPLALPPPQPVEGVEVGRRRTLELPPSATLPQSQPAEPPAVPAAEDLDDAIVPEPVPPPQRRRG